MEIKIVKDSIGRQELVQMANDGFGEMVKAAVDTKQSIMAVGGELHADEEVLLTERGGSRRENIWGINIYPKRESGDCIEFDSMINLKPHYGNRSRDVESQETREKIKNIVRSLIVE